MWLGLLLLRLLLLLLLRLLLLGRVLLRLLLGGLLGRRIRELAWRHGMGIVGIHMFGKRGQWGKREEVWAMV
jgi:hypothetical protein